MIEIDNTIHIETAIQLRRKLWRTRTRRDYSDRAILHALIMRGATAAEHDLALLQGDTSEAARFKIWLDTLEEIERHPTTAQVE